MKNKINSLILILIIFINLFNVTFAYSEETAKTTPYYAHPVTGAIEDPGNNPGIGQGMTENVLSPQALVETTDDGRVFLSVRYNLANYIKMKHLQFKIMGKRILFCISRSYCTNRRNKRL